MPDFARDCANPILPVRAQSVVAAHRDDAITATAACR
jgi:hypothetical protein